MLNRVTVTFSSPEEIPGTYRRINKGLSSKERGSRALGFFAAPETNKDIAKKRYCLAIFYAIISFGFAALNPDVSAWLKRKKIVLIVLLPKITQKIEQVLKNTLSEAPKEQKPETPPSPKQPEPPPSPKKEPEAVLVQEIEKPKEPVKPEPTGEELFQEAENCVKTDIIKARILYREAALKSHRQAMFNAGKHYMNMHKDDKGNIFLPNYDNARAYFFRGTLCADPNSVMELGQIYRGYSNGFNASFFDPIKNVDLAEKLEAEAQRLSNASQKVLDPQVKEQVPRSKQPFDLRLPEEYRDNIGLYAIHKKMGALENPQALFSDQTFDSIKEDLDWLYNNGGKLHHYFNQFIGLLNNQIKKNFEEGIKKTTPQIRLLSFEMDSFRNMSLLEGDIARAEMYKRHRTSYLLRFLFALQKNGYIQASCQDYGSGLLHIQA